MRTFAAQTRDELRIVFARADKNPSCRAAAAASPSTSLIMETWTLGETLQWGRFLKIIIEIYFVDAIDYTTKL